MNSSKIRPAISIPIYKSKLDYYEKISLTSVLKRLKKHDIFILTKKSISREVALIVSDLNDNTSFNLHLVSDQCLESHRSYNQLMLSPEYYQFYGNYSHILVCQLDAYVHSDELIYWCAKDYDYIGAPVYRYTDYWTKDLNLCGNGGFSLRKVSSFISLLKANPKIVTMKRVIKRASHFNWKGRSVIFLKFIVSLFCNKCNLRSNQNWAKFVLGYNEDFIYATCIGRSFNFRVAELEDSRRFAIDYCVNENLEHLAELPFGCHAWWTVPENLKAWAPKIDMFQFKKKSED